MKIKHNVVVRTATDEYNETFIEEVTEITMRELKKSKEDFFKLNPTANAVYHDAEYCRTDKKYYAENYNTGNTIAIKPSRKVYIGFYF